MAAVTITRRISRVNGTRREFELIFTTTAVTGEVDTGLGFVEFVEMQGVDANDNEVQLCKNSKTASAVEDDPGWVHFAAAAGANTYRMTVTGR